MRENQIATIEVKEIAKKLPRQKRQYGMIQLPD